MEIDKIKQYLDYSQTFTVIGLLLMFSAIFEIYDTGIERLFRTPFGLYQGLSVLGLYHIVHGIVHFLEE